jgi:hypothetical protein
VTAINFFIDFDAALVAMDAATFDRHGLPLTPCSKIWPLPHLGMALCGTGLTQFLLAWHEEIQTVITARDIGELDAVTPRSLLRVATSLSKAGQHDSAVYHFGWHPADRRMCGFEYRLANGFASTRLPFRGMTVSPPSPNVTAIWERSEGDLSDESLAALMTEQKRLDDNGQFATRVGIGNEMHVLRILKGGTQCLKVAHQFPDRDEMFKKMRGLAP